MPSHKKKENFFVMAVLSHIVDESQNGSFDRLKALERMDCFPATQSAMNIKDMALAENKREVRIENV